MTVLNETNIGMDRKRASGQDAIREVTMAKLATQRASFDVMDACLQLHGGYGYMWEFPIARAYVDARVQRIYGGTNEIMKEVIARGL